MWRGLARWEPRIVSISKFKRRCMEDHLPKDPVAFKFSPRTGEQSRRQLLDS